MSTESKKIREKELEKVAGGQDPNVQPAGLQHGEVGTGSPPPDDPQLVPEPTKPIKG